jgi:hypothetical protein
VSIAPTGASATDQRQKTAHIAFLVSSDTSDSVAQAPSSPVQVCFVSVTSHPRFFVSTFRAVSLKLSAVLQAAAKPLDRPYSRGR